MNNPNQAPSPSAERDILRDMMAQDDTRGTLSPEDEQAYRDLTEELLSSEEKTILADMKENDSSNGLLSAEDQQAYEELTAELRKSNANLGSVAMGRRDAPSNTVVNKPDVEAAMAVNAQSWITEKRAEQ